MKKAIILGTAVIVLGLLISLGPQFLFKVCVHSEDSYPRCHWSAQAEIGIGILITALGTCMIVFTDLKTHMGLLIGTLLASLIALSIPNTLIGGCGSLAMQCRKIAFPALTAESIVLLVFSAIMITVIVMQKGNAGAVVLPEYSEEKIKVTHDELGTASGSVGQLK